MIDGVVLEHPRRNWLSVRERVIDEEVEGDRCEEKSWAGEKNLGSV